MDLINRIKTRKIIYNKFGKDLSSILYLYLFANCNICNSNIQIYTYCEDCHNIYCKSCNKKNFCFLDKFLFS